MSIELTLPSQETVSTFAIYALVVFFSMFGIFSKCIKKALIGALFVVSIGIAMVVYACDKPSSSLVPSYPDYPDRRRYEDAQNHKVYVESWSSSVKLISEIQEKRMVDKQPEVRNPYLATSIAILGCGITMATVRLFVCITKV